MIITYPDAWTYVLEEDRIERVPFDQTEHFRIAQGFMANPERSLRVLLEREDDEDPGQYVPPKRGT
jgi:hypothetical protein